MGPQGMPMFGQYAAQAAMRSPMMSYPGAGPMAALQMGQYQMPQVPNQMQNQMLEAIQTQYNTQLMAYQSQQKQFADWAKKYDDYERQQRAYQEQKQQYQAYEQQQALQAQQAQQPHHTKTAALVQTGARSDSARESML